MKRSLYLQMTWLIHIKVKEPFEKLIELPANLSVIGDNVNTKISIAFLYHGT